MNYDKYILSEPGVGEYYSLDIHIGVNPPVLGSKITLKGNPVVVSSVSTPEDVARGRGGPVARSMRENGIAYRVNCLPEGHPWFACRMMTANTTLTYKNCSTQVDMPPDVAQKVLAWGKENVPTEDLYDDGDNACGLENEIHVTALYGLTDDNTDVIQDLLSGIQPFTLRMGLVTAFMGNPDYDVLKIDIECPELIVIHFMLRGHLDNVFKFPEYNPHCTIGYVQKGCALPLLGRDEFVGTVVPVNTITFCGRNHERVPVKLG